MLDVNEYLFDECDMIKDIFSEDLNAFRKL